MTRDKQLIRDRFAAGFATYDASAWVQAEVCDRLLDLCGRHVACPPETILEIGAGTGMLTGRLAGLYPSAEWIVNDLSERSAEWVGRVVQSREITYMWGDAERLDFPQADMVASASVVQWFGDRARFIRRAYDKTRDGGHLLLSTFGPDNFRELRSVIGDGLQYDSRLQLERYLESAGYQVVESEEYRSTLYFESPLEVLRHLKATGVNSLSKRAWTPRDLDQFTSLYCSQYLTGDGIPLTYHPILLLAAK